MKDTYSKRHVSNHEYQFTYMDPGPSFELWLSCGWHCLESHFHDLLLMLGGILVIMNIDPESSFLEIYHNKEMGTACINTERGEPYVYL